MKLLLTSGGITNKAIEKALLDLLGKPFAESKLVFIPTAANVEEGDKGWLIDDLRRLQALGFSSIDIVDISVLPKEIWFPRLGVADVLMFGGGNTFHLMRCLKTSGLAEILPAMLKTKVYAGISAGSMVACKDLQIRTSQIIYEDDLNEKENMLALNLVNFYFLPHLNSPFFPRLKEQFIKEVIAGIEEQVYAMDDNGALKVSDGKVEIISEGKYLAYNV